MNRKIVAIGGGGNGRLREDGTYAPYETGPMDVEIIKLTGKDKPLIKVDCIGLVAGLYVPHCDAEGRLKNVKCLLKESEEIGLSISNCCALEIVDDKYRLIISKPVEENFKPYGLKTYWKDKEYIEQYIDDSFEFKSFSELLKRNV